jgi:hypothetical protein
MIYQIYKATYSNGRAYRYHVTDEGGEIQFLVEPTGKFLPTPTRLMTLFDPDACPVGRVEPAPASPWCWIRDYGVELRSETVGRIEECWTSVDRILLRLPCYLVTTAEETLTAYGRRYGDLFYEVYLPPAKEEALPHHPLDFETVDELDALQAQAEPLEDRGERIGEIRRLPSRASYEIDTSEEIPRPIPILLVVVGILADIHINEHAETVG